MFLLGVGCWLLAVCCRRRLCLFVACLLACLLAGWLVGWLFVACLFVVGESVGLLLVARLLGRWFSFFVVRG